jgi:hypothetical protein
MKFIYVVFGGLFCASCLSRNKPSADVMKYGVGWDSVRSVIGLPAINGHLRYERHGNDYAGYHSFKINRPRYDHKSVFWDETGIYLERNYFEGPNKGQRLQIFYGYKQSLDWTYIGYGAGLQYPGADTLIHLRLTKEQADSCLRSWGISY